MLAAGQLSSQRSLQLRKRESGEKRRNNDDHGEQHGHGSKGYSRHRGRSPKASEGTANKGRSKSDDYKRGGNGYEEEQSRRRSSSLNRMDAGGNGRDERNSRIRASLSGSGVNQTSKEERYARSTEQQKAAATTAAARQKVNVSPWSHRRLSVPGLLPVDAKKVELSNTDRRRSIADQFLSMGSNPSSLTSADKDDKSLRARGPPPLRSMIPPKVDENERSARKLTMDTGRRRSFSPRRSIAPMGPRGGLIYQNYGGLSSRFKKADKKQESQGRPGPAAQPQVRRHSSLNNLEKKSRRSLFVTSKSERGVMVTGVPQMLSRARMGFLDEETFFNDSDSDDANKGTTKQDLVQSIKNVLRDSFVRMSRSEGDLQLLDLQEEMARLQKAKANKKRHKAARNKLSKSTQRNTGD